MWDGGFGDGRELIRETALLGSVENPDVVGDHAFIIYFHLIWFCEYVIFCT